MAPWFKFAYHYLWIAPHVLLLGVAAILYLRRLHKNFPVFFIYTIYEFFEFVLLFGFYISGHSFTTATYRFVYIPTLLGSTALRFGIIHEIFINIFSDYPQLAAIAKSSIRWVTAVLVIAAASSVLYFSGPTPDAMVGIRLLERSVNIIQVGLLFFLLLFSRVFGLSWRSYIFGIAIGFAISACAAIAAWTIGLMPLTEESKYLLDLVPMGSFHLTVLVWLGYLIVAEKVVGLATYTPHEMDRWAGELEQSK